MTITAGKLKDFFRYYDASNPSHEAAIELLFEDLTTSCPRLLDDTEAFGWIARYRQQPEKALAPNPLPVPYQSQRDNLSGTGYRECFSSSCAMVAMYWNRIENDDAYNQVRAQFGDSTDAQAQVRALRSLGLQADFCTDGTPARLEQLIDAGQPVPVGWLHKGPLPGTGGGHYCVIHGHTDTHWVVSDPYGDCDLVNGGYPGSHNGASLLYSKKNFNPRWEVDGPGTGWYVNIKP